MAHTFWHRGILIGESELDKTCPNPRQRAGIFHPTAYGRQLFPRLTGILSAGKALKEHLAEHGLEPETLERGEIEDLFDTTPAGQKIMDITRVVSEVEVRPPDGPALHIASLAFSDLEELRALIRAMELDTNDLSDVPPDAPRYIVSLTVRDGPEDDADTLSKPQIELGGPPSRNN